MIDAHYPRSSTADTAVVRDCWPISNGFAKMRIMPDPVLVGDVPNYQRHIRRISFQNRSIGIPFVVVGYDQLL
jgi:hypothetical protein